MTGDGQEEEKAVRCDEGGKGGFACEHWRGAGYEARSDEEEGASRKIPVIAGKALERRGVTIPDFQLAAEQFDVDRRASNNNIARGRQPQVRGSCCRDRNICTACYSRDRAQALRIHSDHIRCGRTPNDLKSNVPGFRGVNKFSSRRVLHCFTTRGIREGKAVWLNRDGDQLMILAAAERRNQGHKNEEARR